MRRTDACMNCGEERDIAAHGLCFTCYRRNGRQAEQREARKVLGVDRHNPAIRSEKQKLFMAYSQVMVGLGKLGLARDDVRKVTETLRPYLLPIAEHLREGGSNEP